MEAQYKLSHADEILKKCGALGDFLLDERGVWPAIERDELLSAETDGLRWRPARELQHLPGALEVKDTPMLPNPFTARELAAFMLEGAGALVADFYGDWSAEPDVEKLDKDSWAGRAVQEAYAAYRHAIAEVGKWDEAALTRRDAAHKAYWKSPQDKALSEALAHAEAEWSAAYKTWLTAMVRCLLEPQAQFPAEPVAQESETLEECCARRPLNKTVHSTKSRRDALWPAIEKAQRQCEDPGDVAAVWAEMQVLAEKKVAPFIGATEDGLQYLKGGTAANFKREHLTKRLSLKERRAR